MQVKVQSVRNGRIASVHPKVAKVMVAKGTVRYVEDTPPVAKSAPVTKVIVPEVPEPVAEVTPDEEPTDADEENPEVEISPRTGLPKRQYNRRDMKAQD